MSEEKGTGISFFEKYLTVWVALCMVAGILIGRFLPAIPQFLGKLEYANVSIPVAVLLWRGDDEFPAQAKLLFDKTITEHLALDIIFGLTVEICLALSTK